GQIFRRSSVRFMTAYGRLRVGRENLVSTLHVRSALAFYPTVLEFAAPRVETLRASGDEAFVILQFSSGTANAGSATVRADRTDRRKPGTRNSVAAQRCTSAEKRCAAQSATAFSRML